MLEPWKQTIGLFICTLGSLCTARPWAELQRIVASTCEATGDGGTRPGHNNNNMFKTRDEHQFDPPGSLMVFNLNLSAPLSSSLELPATFSVLYIYDEQRERIVHSVPKTECGLSRCASASACKQNAQRENCNGEPP